MRIYLQGKEEDLLARTDCEDFTTEGKPMISLHGSNIEDWLAKGLRMYLFIP